MTSRQFLILLVTSITLVILTGVNLVLQTQNQRLGAIAQREQLYLNQSRSTDGTLQQLAIRIAQSQDKEPRMKDILTKNGVKATLNPDTTER